MKDERVSPCLSEGNYNASVSVFVFACEKKEREKEREKETERERERITSLSKRGLKARLEGDI